MAVESLVRIRLDLEPDLLAQVDRYRKDHGFSRGLAIRVLLYQALKYWPDVEVAE